jgi:hypothetical protein
MALAVAEFDLGACGEREINDHAVARAGLM